MSKPPEPGRTTKRPTIEPTYVMRRRRTEALAELLREFEQFKGEAARQDEYETVAVPPSPAPEPAPGGGRSGGDDGRHPAADRA
ncbi:hypothetical protein PV382_32605 [Streptomyces scabiei]|uniref:hypothetical protein n=1 Tax=Streptomyces scabiei TaxID=1930 RepID=UPI0029B8C8D2|nr:hypothetical protein [Streptomyces scabiei]MDX3176955.1 hypothetical protein [Streptomyces scabiei]